MSTPDDLRFLLLIVGGFGLSFGVVAGFGRRRISDPRFWGIVLGSVICFAGIAVFIVSMTSLVRSAVTLPIMGVGAAYCYAGKKIAEACW